jgi:hypothetical protein
VSGPYAGFFHQGAVGLYAEKVPNIQRIIWIWHSKNRKYSFLGGQLHLLPPPLRCVCLWLVFGIGLVLAKPLLCYVLSLWGQRNNLFTYCRNICTWTTAIYCWFCCITKGVYTIWQDTCSLYMKKCNKENKYMTLAKHQSFCLYRLGKQKRKQCAIIFIINRDWKVKLCTVLTWFFVLMKHTNLMIAPIFIRNETLGLKRNSKKTASQCNFWEKHRV